MALVLLVSHRGGIRRNFYAAAILSRGAPMKACILAIMLAAILAGTASAQTVNPPTNATATVQDFPVQLAVNRMNTAVVTAEFEFDGTGVPPYTYTVVNGALPPGMTLDPGGIIYDTPTDVGLFWAIIQGQDSGGQSVLMYLGFNVCSSMGTSGSPKCGDHYDKEKK